EQRRHRTDIAVECKQAQLVVLLVDHICVLVCQSVCLVLPFAFGLPLRGFLGFFVRCCLVHRCRRSLFTRTLSSSPLPAVALPSQVLKWRQLPRRIMYLFFVITFCYLIVSVYDRLVVMLMCLIVWLDDFCGSSQTREYLKSSFLYLRAS